MSGMKNLAISRQLFTGVLTLFIFSLGGAVLSSFAHADALDLQINGADPVKSISQALMSPEIAASWHQREADAAPAWVKNVRTKTLASYFPAGAKKDSPEWRFAIETLVNDARKLDEYSRSLDRSGTMKDFDKKKLEPAIRALTPARLSKVINEGGIAAPLGSWTVERLVTAEKIKFLTRFPNFNLNVMRLLNGRNLRGLTAAAGFLVVGTSGIFITTQFGITPKEVASGVLGVIGGAFVFGPGGDIARTMAAWATRPTQEFITTKVARAMGGWEARLNRYYTWLGGEDVVLNAPEEKGNTTPRFANIAEDGINFAGMTKPQQAANWQLCLKVWVSVRNTFMQLLRDVMHIGRIQQLISPGDEQQAKILVTTLDLTRMALIAEVDTIVNRYLIAIQSDHSRSASEVEARVDRLQTVVERYFQITEELWRDPSLSEELQKAIIERSDAVGEILRTEFRFSKQDMSRLRKNRLERARTIGAMITGAALNEMRSFMTAEANRNLDPEARKFVRAVRKGLRMQDTTDFYLPQIQYLIRSMGYEAGDVEAEKAANRARQCSQLFVPIP